VVPPEALRPPARALARAQTRALAPLRLDGNCRSVGRLGLLHEPHLLIFRPVHADTPLSAAGHVGDADFTCMHTACGKRVASAEESAVMLCMVRIAGAGTGCMKAQWYSLSFDFVELRFCARALHTACGGARDARSRP
jgi:hypothetical protein